jgi:hypothetical protein
MIFPAGPAVRTPFVWAQDYSTAIQLTLAAGFLI